MKSLAKKRFAIRSSRVVTPTGERSAAIIIDNGMIVGVTSHHELPDDLDVIDCGDSVISPGVVDAHVHINEPGRADWEGFETATAAAAAGGVTTLIDMPLNSSPVTTTLAALEEKRTAAEGKCRVDVGFYGGVVPGNEGDLQQLIDSGVFGLKAFMCDSGLDEFPASGEAELRSALATLKMSGVPLLVHAEIIGDAPEPKNERSFKEFLLSRPAQFEVDAIELVTNLCKEFATPVHIVHLATKQALQLIGAAKKDGLPLTVETCPHYLHFCSNEIEDGATSFKCTPPIRDNVNRDELVAAVENGLIETIGSDHSPCPPDMKQLDTGNLSKAWGGIASLQLTLSVMSTLARQQNWSLALLSERLSQRPAEIFGLGGSKGRIENGYDADLVVWNPESKFTVYGKELHHRHHVTPYEGRELYGVVNQTFVRGNLVYDSNRNQDERLVGDPCGALLTRKPNIGIASALNCRSDDGKFALLESCCASKTWIERMIENKPCSDDEEVISRAKESWNDVSEGDLMEAFSAHPRIGDVDTLRAKYANTKALASGEQSGVDSADEAVLQRLAAANDEYFDKFGFIFIVCATGKTANEMLDLLEARLKNDRDTELKNAAAEQLKITIIRLRKLIA